MIVHEPHGTLELLVSDASDLDVVNAARVSYAKRSETLSAADEKLVAYLLKNRHGTPFEHTYFKFHVRAPIFVFREWHRHRIGISINEESARYVELAPDFYYPDDEHCRKQVGKPGAYSYEQMNEHEAEHVVRRNLEEAYEFAYAKYEYMMHEGVAKEIARACLPVAIYSQMYWTCNARSLMSFLSLRNAPTALREIKDYAEAMEEIFYAQMPITAQAFVDNGRIAP